MPVIDSGVRPVSAVLLPDGSIEVDLSIPDLDEVATATIPATRASERLTESTQRIIDLEGGDHVDARVRQLITEYIRAVEKHIAEMQARQTQKATSRRA